jgi:AbrB family looped-hinge helix DNA binding protein
MKEIISTVTQKGQVTIPVEVRRYLGVDAPDKIMFVLDGDEVLLRPVPRTFEQLFGAVPALRGGESSDFEKEITEALDDEADRLAQELAAE